MSINQEALASRITGYYRDLRRHQQLQNVVSQPYFNATKEQAVLRAYEELGTHLKIEAGALWELGVDVYH